MNIYVWEQVKNATSSYHENGGVVVFAETEERARQLANSIEGCNILENEHVDVVRACEDCEELVIIFPNAGCC